MTVGKTDRLLVPTAKSLTTYPDPFPPRSRRISAPSTQPSIFTNDQFGPDTYTFYGPRELCVPSEVVVP